MVKFYEDENATYRLLAKENGIWLINVSGKTAPVCISKEVFAQMHEVPADEVIPPHTPPQWVREEANKRVEIIKPLTESEQCIVDPVKRANISNQIAKEQEISSRTVYRYYYSYLAKGIYGLFPTQRKRKTNKKTPDQTNIQKALNQFFYSPYRMSLRMAYEMMLLNYYKDESGILGKEYPTYNQFRYYFRKHRDSKKESILREGIGEHQKNRRPLMGAGNSGVDYIGLYEMDATLADVYLVSHYDRQLIGRPYIYMAIDVASRLIAGIYVGLEGNSNSVMACLANAAMDKVQFCQKYGIDIEESQWPSQGMPGCICTDRGNEFTGEVTKSLCEMYRVEIIGLPPYRPDLKGYVEKAFDCLQNRYKPLLHGMGVIEDPSTANGAPDYRKQACLDLHEFTKILIQCVLYYNSSNVLNDFVRTPEMKQDNVQPFACNVWNWYKKAGAARLVNLDPEGLRLMLLPRGVAQITRYGLKFNSLFYTNEKYEAMFIKGASKGNVTIAYDESDTGTIYIIENGEYIPFSLTMASRKYDGLTMMEMKALLDGEKEVIRGARNRQIEGSLSCNEHILQITKSARQRKQEESSGKKDTSTQTMKLKRKKEKV